MFKVGDVCVKIAGRDAGQTCVIVDVLEGGLVLVDGSTRRRKCNTRHLEPLDRSVDVKKGASHEAVMKALGLEPVQRKPKKAGAKPSVKRKATEKPAREPKAKKAAPEKKAEKASKQEGAETDEPAKKAPAKKTAKKSAKE